MKLRDIILTGCLLLTLSCDNSEEEVFATPYAKAEGKWIISSTTILGQKIPINDGSYLQFSDCGAPPCNGIDYEATEDTQGTFTYTFSSDQKSLTIVDISADGGVYDGEWTVEAFSNTTLKISADSFIGLVAFEFKKQ